MNSTQQRTERPLDRRTALCLACASSLPPSSKSIQEGIFTTSCCNRPICQACLTSNPRLARYNPCLLCLSGVGVVSARSSSGKEKEAGPRNVDGSVRDEDTFLIGDDEDDDDQGEPSNQTAPPPYSPLSTPSSVDLAELPNAPSLIPPARDSQVESNSSALKYYIRRNDTLQGISLRLGIDGRELCRLNKLPLTTLTTTPHVLHTRGSLILPPHIKEKLGSLLTLSDAEDKERQVRRARERAEKRLQTLTKEADWRVAKAYVSLMDDADEAMRFGAKQKELPPKHPPGPSNLELLALDQYLSDDEWEAQQLSEGHAPNIQGFPFSTFGSPRKGGQTKDSGWWRWISTK